MVKRGEVWWYEHPHAGRRPMLVLTRAEAIPVLADIVGVPITTTVRGIPTEVELDSADGMPAACCATLDGVQRIRVALCTEFVTTLSPARMREVCVALSAATGC